MVKLGSADSQWPASQVRVYGNAVSEALIDELTKDANGIASCPNYWVPRDVIEKADASESIEEVEDIRTLGEEVVVSAFRRVFKDLLPENWTGAEWWCQVKDAQTGMAFHMDKDEHALVELEQWRHPLFSSIVYLNKEKEGPTLVLDQWLDVETEEMTPSEINRGVFIFPGKGNLAVFDGSLAHGVLQSGSSHTRITFLINWWAGDRPHNVNRCPVSDVEKFNLSPFTPPRLGNERKYQEESPAVVEETPVCDIAPIVERLKGGNAEADDPALPFKGVLGENGFHMPNLAPEDVKTPHSFGVEHAGYVVWQTETADILMLPKSMFAQGDDEEGEEEEEVQE